MQSSQNVLIAILWDVQVTKIRRFVRWYMHACFFSAFGRVVHTFDHRVKVHLADTWQDKNKPEELKSRTALF